MRLWHKDLIPYLPRQQLLGQWRELCCIAKNIATNDTPNHILVNKIMDYDIWHLNTYASAIYSEMTRRGYAVDWNKYYRWINNPYVIPIGSIFPNWHNDRYFWQCYYNLQEKYDCGGLTDEEWGAIVDSVSRLKKGGETDE